MEIQMKRSTYQFYFKGVSRHCSSWQMNVWIVTKRCHFFVETLQKQLQNIDEIIKRLLYSANELHKNIHTWI